jgi:hypothetical protein
MHQYESTSASEQVEQAATVDVMAVVAVAAAQ